MGDREDRARVFGEVLLEPTRIAYESALPGFGDRPTARFVTAKKKRPYASTWVIWL